MQATVVERLGPQKCYFQSCRSVDFILTSLCVGFVYFLISCFLSSPPLDSGSSNNAAHFHEQLPALQRD